MENEWVLDSLVGFLHSPPWRCCVEDFIDRNCLIFDSEDENQLAYTDVHKQYQELISGLMEQLMGDLGMTGEQFLEACFEMNKSGSQHKDLFNQVLAVEDFCLFKSMMVKRNVELNEQVLGLLKQHSPLLKDGDDQKHHTMKAPSAPSPPEEWMMKESGEDIESALLKSKVEYELAQSREEEEFQKLLEQACKESLELCLSEKSVQKAQCHPGLRSPPTSSQLQTSQPPSTSSLPELKRSESIVKSSEQVKAISPPATASSSVTGAEAAAKWIENARQEAASLPVQTTTSTKVGTSANDLRQREKYLKKQRDQLLALKRQQREKELSQFGGRKASLDVTLSSSHDHSRSREGHPGPSTQNPSYL